MLTWVYRNLLLCENPHSVYAACPSCGSTSVERVHAHDPVDPTSRVPWSVLQRILGGLLFHCVRCRLQFHDCRPRIAYSLRMKSTPRTFAAGAGADSASRSRAQSDGNGDTLL